MKDFLYIKNGRKALKLFYSDIQYIESSKRYVRFITIERTYLHDCSLSDLENNLPPDLFCRIHRSYIISFRNARQMDAKVVHVAGRDLPIGKNYRCKLWVKLAKHLTV